MLVPVCVGENTKLKSSFIRIYESNLLNYLITLYTLNVSMVIIYLSFNEKDQKGNNGYQKDSIILSNKIYSTICLYLNIFSKNKENNFIVYVEYRQF